MVIRVARIVEKALGKEDTYVATDDNQIKKIVEEYGFKAVMTSKSCLTGTDRVYDFSKQIEADIYINVQGDEPLLDYREILKIIEVKKQNYNYVVNGMCQLNDDEEPNNINIPKVIVNNRNDLIYISRLPIPGIKSLEYKDSQILKNKSVFMHLINKSLKLLGRNEF